MWYYEVKDEDGNIIATETFDSVDEALAARKLDTRNTSSVGSKTENAKNER